MAGINTIIHIPLIGGILNARGRCGQFQSATLENFVVFADLLNTASDGDAGLAGNNDLSGSAFDGRANSLATDFNGNGAASRHGLRRAGGVGQLLSDTRAAAGNATPSILQSVSAAIKGYFFGIAGLALNGNIPVNGEVNRGIMLDIRNILAVNLCLDSGRASDGVGDFGSSDGDLSGQRLGSGGIDVLYAVIVLVIAGNRATNGSLTLSDSLRRCHARPPAAVGSNCHNAIVFGHNATHVNCRRFNKGVFLTVDGQLLTSIEHLNTVGVDRNLRLFTNFK